MSTALDNAGHNCNIVTEAESLIMAKQHLIDHYGTLRLHDRHRLLGRLARPAAGRQRLPRHLPGHPAAVQLPGRLVDRPAARRLPPDARRTSRTRPVGHRGRRGPRRRSPPSRAIPTTATRSSSTPSTGTTLANPTQRLRRASRAAQLLQPADEPRRRPLHARGLHDQRVRAAPAERVAANEHKLGHGFAGLPIDNVGVQYGLERARRQGTITPGPVRRPQREDRRRGHRPQPDRGTVRGRPSRR